MLELASSQEERERIEWLHARRVFFDGEEEEDTSFCDGLELARTCQHADARFLVSLFPNGAPRTDKEAAAAFLAAGDDARALCWAGECDKHHRLDLWRRSAQRGYAWAKCRVATHDLQELDEATVRKLLAEAAQDGEVDGMRGLAHRMGFNHGKGEWGEARFWTRRAAFLGCPSAQYILAAHHCRKGSVDRAIWMRRAATQTVRVSRATRAQFANEGVRIMSDFDADGFGRVVFELGRACGADYAELGAGRDAKWRRAVERARGLYVQWCNEAKEAIACWMWLGKKLGVAKDVRLLVADLIWRERPAWSERNRKVGN